MSSSKVRGAYGGAHDDPAPRRSNVITCKPQSPPGKCNKVFRSCTARQVGLQPCDICYSAFKKVAEHYVQGNKSKGDTSRDELMALAVDACSCLKEDMIGGLTQDLVKELDACILSFFAFHWDHADMLLAAASAV